MLHKVIEDMEAELNDCCPECSSEHLSRAEKRAEIFCYECGFVVEEKMIDLGEPEKVFNREEELSKKHYENAGKNGIHLGSFIDGKNPLMRRLSRLNNISKQDQQIKRRDKLPIYKIKRISRDLGVSEHIQERAVDIYVESRENNLLGGRNNSGNAYSAASLFLALKEEDEDVDSKHIGKLFGVSTDVVSKLATKSERYRSLDGPDEAIDNLCKEFDIPEEAKEKIDEYNKMLEDHDNRFHPGTMAGAIFYMGSVDSGVNLSRSAIARKVGVSLSSINKCYRKLSMYIFS